MDVIGFAAVTATESASPRQGQADLPLSPPALPQRRI
jgi:hypothetical protein